MRCLCLQLTSRVLRELSKCPPSSDVWRLHNYNRPTKRWIAMEKESRYTSVTNPTMGHKEGDVGRKERLRNWHIDSNDELNDGINFTTSLNHQPLSLSLLCAHRKEGWPRATTSIRRSILGALWKGCGASFLYIVIKDARDLTYHS